MIDFSKSVEAGKIAAKATEDTATTLAVASATGKWSAEHTKTAVQALFMAAGYIGQVLAVLEAVDGQLKEIFPPVPSAPDYTTAKSFGSRRPKGRR